MGLSHDRGRSWSPSYVSRTFRALVDEAGLPPIRFHDLRHGAATLSLAAGNELRVVQALLGHSSIVLTADTYTSVLPCLAQQAADATARGQDPQGGGAPAAKRVTEGTAGDGKSLNRGDTSAAPGLHTRSKPTDGAREYERNRWWALTFDCAPSGTRTPNPLVKSPHLPMSDGVE